jgi:putative transposase
LPLEATRGLLEPDHPHISIARQCALVGLTRSSYSDMAAGETAEKLHCMRWLDAQDTRMPFYGVRRLIVWLRQQGYTVHPKRVARLLQTMGLEPIDPTPRLSPPHPEHRVYPSGLRGVPMPRGRQVWRTDMPSIRLHAGCVSLVAVRDWCSR